MPGSELFGSAWAQLGAVGLLFLVLLLLVMALTGGRLWTNRAVSALREETGKRVDLAERTSAVWQDVAAKWQATADANGERADKMTAALGEVVVTMRSMEMLIRALPTRRDDAA